MEIETSPNGKRLEICLGYRELSVKIVGIILVIGLCFLIMHIKKEAEPTFEFVVLVVVLAVFAAGTIWVCFCCHRLVMDKSAGLVVQSSSLFGFYIYKRQLRFGDITGVGVTFAIIKGAIFFEVRLLVDGAKTGNGKPKYLFADGNLGSVMKTAEQLAEFLAVPVVVAPELAAAQAKSQAAASADGSSPAAAPANPAAAAPKPPRPPRKSF